MPWFPDFVSAVELARRQTRATGQADPVNEYFSVLQSGAARELDAVWPGEVVIHDPRAGEIRGHHRFRRFVRENQSLWAEHHASVETVASTSVGGRAVVELVVNVRDFEGKEVAWPIAVVAESPDDLSIVFRTYCSQWPVDGSRHLRPPMLKSGEAYPGDVAGGGIRLEHCVLTDDGTRCALEYNCVRWGSHDLPPQAGIAVYERSREGFLKAVRMYDDIEAPLPHAS